MTRRLVAVTVAVAVALIAAFWFVAWSPTGHRLATARKAVASANADHDQLQAQLVSLRAGQRRLPELKAQLAALDQLVPATVSLDTAVDQISAAAAAAGVSVATLTPTAQGSTSSLSSSSSPGGPPSVAVVLSASGSYPAMVDFVQRLQGAPRLFVVEGMTLSGSGSAITANLSLHIFYRQGAGK